MAAAARGRGSGPGRVRLAGIAAGHRLDRHVARAPAEDQQLLHPDRDQTVAPRPTLAPPARPGPSATLAGGLRATMPRRSPRIHAYSGGSMASPASPVEPARLKPGVTLESLPGAPADGTTQGHGDAAVVRG